MNKVRKQLTIKHVLTQNSHQQILYFSQDVNRPSRNPNLNKKIVKSMWQKIHVNDFQYCDTILKHLAEKLLNVVQITIKPVIMVIILVFVKVLRYLVGATSPSSRVFVGAWVCVCVSGRTRKGFGVVKQTQIREEGQERLEPIFNGTDQPRDTFAKNAFVERERHTHTERDTHRERHRETQRERHRERHRETELTFS